MPKGTARYRLLLDVGAHAFKGQAIAHSDFYEGTSEVQRLVIGAALTR